MSPDKIIIDAKDTVLGRLASYAAKQSLLGKNVVILNCDQAVITGNRSVVLTKYKQARARGGSTLKGPHFPKEPFRLLKRTIRGMLSHRQIRGTLALKRIICYNQSPPEYKDASLVSIKRDLKTKSLTLKELSSLI